MRPLNPQLTRGPVSIHPTEQLRADLVRQARRFGLSLRELAGMAAEAGLPAVVARLEKDNGNG